MLCILNAVLNVVAFVIEIPLACLFVNVGTTRSLESLLWKSFDLANSLKCIQNNDDRDLYEFCPYLSLFFVYTSSLQSNKKMLLNCSSTMFEFSRTNKFNEPWFPK